MKYYPLTELMNKTLSLPQCARNTFSVPGHSLYDTVECRHHCFHQFRQHVSGVGTL